MTDCFKCRDWGDCMGKPYYTPSELKYCRWQILWLLWHMDELQSSLYPSDGSSYTTWPPILGKGAKSGAFFETPAGLAGMILGRLNKTGKDGGFLIDQVKKLPNDYAETFALFYHHDINKDAKAALGFICGREKKTPYYIWRWRDKKK